MSSGDVTEGPTDQEIQLGQQANDKYAMSQELGGGEEYLLNSVAVDNSGRDKERANSQNAMAFSAMPDNQEEVLPADLRPYSTGGVAAEAQEDAEAANDITNLSGSTLGTMANASNAQYAEGQRTIAQDAAETALSQQKAALLPSLAGNMAGAYLGGGMNHWMDADSPYRSNVVLGKSRAYFNDLFDIKK